MRRDRGVVLLSNMKVEEFRREMKLSGFTLRPRFGLDCCKHSWDKSIQLSCFQINYEVDELEMADDDWHASFGVYVTPVTENGGNGGVGLWFASGSMNIAFIESVQSLISHMSESAWKHLSEMTVKLGEAAMTGFIPG